MRPVIELTYTHDAQGGRRVGRGPPRVVRALGRVPVGDLRRRGRPPQARPRAPREGAPLPRAPRRRGDALHLPGPRAHGGRAAPSPRYTGGWASGRGWRAPSPDGATRSCGRSCAPRSRTGWTGASRTHFLSYNPKPDAPTHNKSLPRIAGQAFYSRLFCLIVDAATRIPERKCPRRSICF